jgi:hypothetical protein
MKNNRKFKTTVRMESIIQPDGTRKAFNIGDIIEERYIAPESIDPYIKGCLLIEVKEETHGTSGRNSKTVDNAF